MCLSFNLESKLWRKVERESLIDAVFLERSFEHTLSFAEPVGEVAAAVLFVFVPEEAVAHFRGVGGFGSFPAVVEAGALYSSGGSSLGDVSRLGRVWLFDPRLGDDQVVIVARDGY